MDNSEKIVGHEEHDSMREVDHEDEYEETGNEAFQTLEHLTDDDMEDEEDLPNLHFYQNKKKFTPGGVYIEDFHQKWFGDYDRLEYVHTYIQWLFPIQEKGMNFESHELSLKEIKRFHEDEMVKENLLVSYKLMLDFYGITLVNDKTGEVARAGNWRARFKNLNRNSHNNLRITRILKCLGLLGFGHYQAPLVRFFLDETLVQGTLPRVKQSALDYFIYAVLDKSKRNELIGFAIDFMSGRKLKSCSNELWKEKEMANYKENDIPNKVFSSDSTFQSDQKDLMNSKIPNKDEIESDPNKDTSNDKSLSSESRNDENVSGVCQESDTQALPILSAGNANTADTNKGTDAASGLDFPRDHHVASVQEVESKAGNNEISNTVQKATEQLDANGNDNTELAEQSKVQSDDEAANKTTNTSHHSTIDNVANVTPLSGISGSEQQDRGDKREPCDNNELRPPPFDQESKEELQQRGCESPEDSVVTGSSTYHEGNSARYDAEKSADMNSYKFTESDENILRNRHGESEQHNLDDELDTSKQEEEKEKLEHPVHHESSMDENPDDRLADACVSNDVTSNHDDTWDSKDVKDGDNTESGQATAHRNDVNSSQGIVGNDSETEEGSKEMSIKKEHTEIGCVTGGGGEKEEND